MTIQSDVAIRVAIVRSRDDVLAELIEAEVKACPELRLVGTELITPEEANEKLFTIAQKADVLITIGNFPAELMEDIVERHASAIVCGIMIGSDTVSVRLKKVGAQQLIDTLVALSRDRNRECSRLLEYQFIEGDSYSRGCQFIEVRSSEDRIVQAADSWVRQALLSYWSRLPKTEFDVLGHARSPETLATLLAPPERIEISDEEECALEKLFAALKKEGCESDAPLARLYNKLHLKEVEFKLLLLALAPELDVNFQIAFGLLNDDLGRKYPTFALGCAILGNPTDIRREIEQAGNLVRWRLLESGPVSPHADEILRLSQPMNAWLLGNRTAPVDDPAINPFVSSEPFAGAALLEMVESRSIIRDLAMSFGAGEGRWIALPDSHLDRWRARCELAANESGTPLLRCLPAGLMTLPRAEQREAAIRLARTAHLLGMIPVVDFMNEPTDENRLTLLEYFSEAFAQLPQSAVLIASDVDRYVGSLNSRAVVPIGLLRIAEAELSAIFAAAAKRAGVSLSQDDCQRLAMTFPLPLEAIEAAVELVELGDPISSSPDTHYKSMARACSRVASPNLSRLAHRIEPTFVLDQVILPPEQHAQLKEIVGNVTNAATVLNRWGFGDQLPYGRGVAALFSGPSGTGKTMAAQAVARELGTEIFEVDLSRIVSKYIGETEKNLDLVFTEAERANAVLALHEADATAGKRGETKDAHDRYANLEVAYLLQRMESFSGLAILTTNFKQNIDPAFMRRLRFVIEFPKPDAKAREVIWRQCLPQAAPVAATVDFRLLARQIELTGGSIRQITLRAAFAAANESAAIEMRHILAAMRAELFKLGENGAVRELAAIEAFHSNELAA